jgi:hypothetical protein
MISRRCIPSLSAHVSSLFLLLFTFFPIRREYHGAESDEWSKEEEESKKKERKRKRNENDSDLMLKYFIITIIICIILM